MVFEDTLERRILVCKKKSQGSKKNTKDFNNTCCYYTDIQLGLYLIRGDTTVLMGEVDEEHVASVNSSSENILGQENTIGNRNQRKNMIQVSLEDFERLQEKWAEGANDETEDGEEEEKIVETLTWDFDTDLVV